MKERIVIITGANSGIGKAAALKFATESYTVIMACRNFEKSSKVQKEIMEASQNERVHLMELDVSSFESIRTFCSAFKSRYPKLDKLIHNAAYFNHGEKFQLSRDHIELTFATNVFGPFLMTTLLLDHLKNSEDPRILHASSNITKHFFDPKKTIDFDHLHDKPKNKSHSVYRNYCHSKMALVMLTFKMAEVFKPYGINVNALQINGAKMSKETIRKAKPWWRPIMWIQNLYFALPEFMADHYFTICTSNDFKHVTGKIINERLEIMLPAQENPSITTHTKQILGSKVYPRYADRTDVIDRVWEMSMMLTQG